jgi:hypothetical protein
VPVYDHPRNLDAAGYPTWQLRAHPRDTSTTGYMALGDDILAWRVMPSSQRAYNVVEVAFVDPVAGPGLVTAADTRLNADGSQGSAPFRRQRCRRLDRQVHHSRRITVPPLTARRSAA